MSRSNTGSTSNYLGLSTPPVLNAPLTFACWFRPASVAATHNLVNIAYNGGNYFALAYDGANAYGLGARAVLMDVNGSAVAASAAAPNVVGGWVHCAGVATSTTSRQAFVNGVGGTVNTTSASTLDALLSRIGIFDGGFSPMNGSIAHAAMWSVALSESEIARLARGAHPRSVRLWALTGWPLVDGDLSEYKGGRRLTQTGTMPVQGNNPRIIVPRRSLLYASAAGTATDLVIAAALHAHAADNLVLTTAAVLAVAEALHAHAADNLGLTSATALTVAESAHAHTADAPTLTTQSVLAVAESQHAHAADNLGLSTATALAIAEALHAHAADNASLSSATGLDVADATHAHGADNIGLSTSDSISLSVADAAHAHAADNLALTSQLALAIQEALHAHAADGLALTTASQLAVADALHAHAADNVALSTAPVLLIAEALHAHTADGVTMTVDAWLVVADALHAHLADGVVLFVPGGGTLREVLLLQSPVCLAVSASSLIARAVAADSGITRAVTLASAIDIESTS